MNRNILEMWAILEQQSDEQGLLKRLYTNVSGLYIYAVFQVFQNYEKRCGIALSFDESIHIDVSEFSNLRDLQVSSARDSSFKNNNLLIINLLQDQNRDVFAVMCENMIQSVLLLCSEELVVRTIINQLKKWQELFEKLNANGLTLSEQLGFYGELHFLQKYLAKSNNNSYDVLHTWIGVNKASRDFQGGSWAVEVKTTSTNNPQKVTINGEKQLDETLLKNLFLFHISVEVSNGNGNTLCQKVAAIREILENDISALLLFNAKLIDAGYFDRHKSFYLVTSYKVRNENYYNIENEFPRIRENELRRGVGDVKYSINLAMCGKYSVSEDQLFERLNSDE